MTQSITYAILAVAIAFEVAGTTLLAQSAQFTRPMSTLGMAVCYAIAFYCLSLLTGALPVGIIYALWSGLGIIFIAAVNFVIFRQTLDAWALVGLGLIIAGVLVINTLSKSVSH